MRFNGTMLLKKPLKSDEILSTQTCLQPPVSVRSLPQQKQFPLLEGEISERFRQNLIMKPIAGKFKSIIAASKPVPSQSGRLDAMLVQIYVSFHDHYQPLTVGTSQTTRYALLVYQPGPGFLLWLNVGQPWLRRRSGRLLIERSAAPSLTSRLGVFKCPWVTYWTSHCSRRHICKCYLWWAGCYLHCSLGRQCMDLYVCM